MHAGAADRLIDAERRDVILDALSVLRGGEVLGAIEMRSAGQADLLRGLSRDSLVMTAHGR
jgi:hypothetical protein